MNCSAEVPPKPQLNLLHPPCREPYCKEVGAEAQRTHSHLEPKQRAQGGAATWSRAPGTSLGMDTPELPLCCYTETPPPWVCIVGRELGLRWGSRVPHKSTLGNQQEQAPALPFLITSSIFKNGRLGKPLCFLFLILEAFPVNNSPFPCSSALPEQHGTGHWTASVRKGTCREPYENQTGLVRLLTSKILQPTCIQSEGPIKVHAAPLELQSGVLLKQSQQSSLLPSK